MFLSPGTWLHVNPIDSNTWRAQKAELLRHVWIGYLHFAGCNGMLPLSATLCCHWRHSRCTIILPLSAIQSFHLIRSGLDCQIQPSAAAWRLRSEQQAVRCGFPLDSPGIRRFGFPVFLECSVSDFAIFHPCG